MSLQLVANHLAQKGRGPDSTLVHMSNKELAGLQALAEKNGGSLTTNPHTGLPEAGFLDNILPSVVGAGISYFSGGSIDPITAGALVGGGTALATGDLNKGISAGLGAWGGAGMVGGLAGLGAAPVTEGVQNAATQAARDEAVKQAVANNTYKDAVSEGFGSFKQSPLSSLSALGGGSALKGGLPILAALTPSLAEQQENKAPAQKPGYIRKYALDPVTGQYKQTSVYEAGGDPNVDVTSKAGTAGAFGGVAQPATRTFADGGSTSNDSQKIYDYLMGKGENPMQFTHQAPQVNFDKYKPITPTTGILDKKVDEYGNLVPSQRGGNGPREPEDPNSFSAQWAAMSDDQKAAWQAENPGKAALQEGVKFALAPVAYLANRAQNYFAPKDPNAYQRVSPPDQFAGYQPNTRLPAGIPTPDIKPPGGDFSATPPQGDPRQRQEAQQAQDARVAAFDASRESTRSGGGGGMGGDGGGYSNANAGNYGWTRSGGGEGGGWAAGGPTHGGIADLHQYNLGSYSDGGRLLKGPGDGVSDDIPATIGHGQPARLADGEFVVPARIVSELGNGSTDAGARELYKMMDRIQAGRKKTVGKDQVAKNSKSVRHLPA